MKMRDYFKPSPEVIEAAKLFKEQPGLHESAAYLSAGERLRPAVTRMLKSWLLKRDGDGCMSLTKLGEMWLSEVIGER